MNFDLRPALNAVDQNAQFIIANQARPGSSYLFANFLPEEKRYSYQAKGGRMIIRAVMAGLMALDSPYPEGGAAESSSFNEETAKVGTKVTLPEAVLRELQELLLRMTANGRNTIEEVKQTALNFQNKMIIQPMLARTEWLRGQAMTTGMIDWTFNGKRLLVDYGIPAKNKLPARTGNFAYGGTESMFWTDIGLINEILNDDVKAIIVHQTTARVIIANPVNNIKVVSFNKATGVYVIQRLVNRAGNTVDSSDARDTVELITYSEEGEVWDLANPGGTVKIPFMPKGAMIGIGSSTGDRFIVGSGSTITPSPVAIGYTHLAPTVEGGGIPGRYAKVFAPEQAPYTIVGEGASNVLPVIDAPERIVIATTQMT